MRRGRRIILAGVLAGLGFLGAGIAGRAARRHAPALRTGVVTRATPLPASVKLVGTLLGSFRALLVDMLWIRADALQQEGRVFAAAELARWITLLQSNVEESWRFQAWNLGYNIPAMLPVEDRWPYVASALELLWREGLAANPGSLGLCYEIGWFWEHKIGGDTDAAAPRYRAAVREQALRILGSAPVNLEEYVEAAPLLPQLERDPDVRAFVEEVSRRAGLDGRAEWVRIWNAPEEFLGEGARELHDRRDKDVLLRVYDRGLRDRAWRERFGIGLSALAEAWERYGDIGLYEPDSFVVVWTKRALDGLLPGAMRLDALGLWRMRLRALKRLFSRGRVQLAMPIDRDYQELIRMVRDDPVHGDQAVLFEGERNAFLADAVPLLYLSIEKGAYAKARELYGRLRGLGSSGEEDLGLDGYVAEWLLTKLTVATATYDEGLFVVKSLIGQAFRAYGKDDAESAARSMAMAREMLEVIRQYWESTPVPLFAQLVDEVRLARSNRQEGS